MRPSPRPLDRISILVVGDDVLAAFTLRRKLAAAGARVVMGDARETIPYLEAAALAAVVVAADINPTDRTLFLQACAECPAPWVVYGDGAEAPCYAAASARLAGDPEMLVETLAALCAPMRH